MTVTLQLIIMLSTVTTTVVRESESVMSKLNAVFTVRAALKIDSVKINCKKIDYENSRQVTVNAANFRQVCSSIAAALCTVVDSIDS